MKANPKIDNFIQDTLFIDEEKGNMLISLRKLVLKVFPGVQEEIKYSGLVFTFDKRLFCGIFVRKDYFSVEFDNGSKMSDSDNFWQCPNLEYLMKN